MREMHTDSLRSPAGDNPFPGLRPFDEDEAQLFFGREREISELLGRMMRQHFLAVLGSSGCGKSSLIKAGLIPSLKYERMDDGEAAWRVAVMRPGSNPFKQLAIALSSEQALGKYQRHSEAGVPIMQMILRRGPLGIAEATRETGLPPEAKLLVLVDQFEELFRFSERAERASALDEARAFINLLLTAAGQRDWPIYVVLTMRSEFLGQCAVFQGLAEAITNGLYLLADMTRDQLREVIQRPITAHHGRISERLVNRLLNDLGGNADQLPILQHALMRLWAHWVAVRGEGPMDLQHYEVIGELKGSLSGHAESIYQEVLKGERERKLAETLFRCLTETTSEGQTVRKPTRLGDICRRADATQAEMKLVIEQFRENDRSFLMPPKGVELDDETRIDISHESLIRQWKRLSDWAEVEAKELKLYAGLKHDSVSWMEKGRNPSWLYSGSRLAEAQRWAADHPNLLDNDLAKEFLANSSEKEKYASLLLRAEKWNEARSDDSLLLRGKELAEAEQWLLQAGASADLRPILLKKEVKDLVVASRRADRRLTVLKALLVAAFVSVLAIAFYAHMKQADAEKQKETAEEQTTAANEQRDRAEGFRRDLKELQNRLGISGIEGKNQQMADAGVQIQKLRDLVKGRQSIRVRYFYKPQDGTKVIDTLRAAGYIVSPEPQVRSPLTNAIWWGAGIKLEDIQFIAYSLIQDGINIQYIGRSEANMNQIQIGGRSQSAEAPLWTVRKVQMMTALPIDNEVAPIAPK